MWNFIQTYWPVLTMGMCATIGMNVMSRFIAATDKAEALKQKTRPRER